jgi:YVTN family beta-propeller protein
VNEPGRNAIAVMFGSPAAERLEIPIPDQVHPNAPQNQNPVNLVGNLQSQRIYAIAQGPTACPNGGTTGTVTAIETTTETISSVLSTGNCPVYGVMSADNRRAFILNQGDGTVTVIDSQQNRFDRTINVGQGPVWADIFNTGSMLAVVNSTDSTLSLIDISLDTYGNDSPDFGRVLATVPVGLHPGVGANPVSVSVLQDGSRAYVANQGDGTVSVVSLTSFQLLKTIPVAGHPISIAATTGTPTGKVYVVSPDSNLLTIIRTDNDSISNSLQLTGAGVQVRVSAP